ncbi:MULTISPECIES: acetoin dehydrogenase operon transcriptional activator AcoR [Bacillus]|uniref:acetoin dehydrogenase operon transcriptional activator AcoR n=1 Tax=Bacillus TaxID=1386 RepID=UPI00061DC0EC|nr:MULTISPECIES: acetoin dehydrogenase operon transcriptional activator AcoR [Bacillus]AKE22645.1 transcriptional regulator [Bacillus sp. LM 4-2]MCM3190998.1 acetoin dehydrogenase operon transcriptional activator AcoR [Bacillus subtilis]MDN4184622.1 acetoin dehydrogenase operon transcriptional activator AcoR [Bacillus subtilis]QAR91868.1 sigma-54-dependent Fis family transcriptional regulator [Bacillus subtilis]QAT35465.1 sigma-54-dependent Fis family transcriptional regulator [Bacillus subtil
MNSVPNDLQTWKRFVKDGVLDEARLRKRIAESWHRCKKAEVNPYLEKGPKVLQQTELDQQSKKHSFFLTTAKPYLEKLLPAIKEMEMMALLIDSDGVVLALDGHPRALYEAKRINFVEGACWTETAVGTNAIGTALHISEPVAIQGSEHYSIASHLWNCSAAPIHHEDGSLAGVIDISCPAAGAHPHMLGIASAIAYAAERELAAKSREKELELISRFGERAASSVPMVLCNNKQHIISASIPIRTSMPDWQGRHLYELKERGYSIEKAVTIGDGGTCFYLSEQKKKKVFRFNGVIGKSGRSQAMLMNLERAAAADATVCLSGETGTGKEVAARALHENSERRHGPFVAVNCGAIPSDLIESELFGYAEGAFTGAKRNGYKGAFQKANQGTLFLDEIGEISHSMQVALLRVLQERKITPIGGTKEIPVDIRVIAATHCDLRELAENGKIREDLFYRLHVYPIELPPLRDRTEDIPDLFEYYKQKNHWPGELPSDFCHVLKQWKWPGNIRELFNVFERLSIRFPEGGLGDEPLSALLEAAGLPVSTAEKQPAAAGVLKLREQIQKDMMIKALESAKGNVSQAAKISGIPRSTFYKRLKKFNLSAES